MKKSILLLLALGLAAVACVDPAYDPSNINPEVNVLKDVEIPIGSVNQLSLGDILKLDSQDGVIRLQDNGDYYLYYEGAPIEQNIELNVKHIDGVKVDEAPFYATAPAAISLASDFGQSAALPVETKFEVKVTSENFPKEVTKVYRIDGTGSVIVKLAYDGSVVPFSKVSFKDVVISFPAWIDFSGVETAGFVVEGNLVKAASVELEAGKPLPIVCAVKGIDFSKVPEGQGIVDDGLDENQEPKRKLVVDDEVVLTASVYVNSADKSSNSGNFRTATFSKSLEIGQITISSVRAGIDVDRVVEGTEVSLEGLPAELSTPDTRIDPYELRLFFNLQNAFPVSASLYTTVNALSQDAQGNPVARPLPLGSAADPIVIAGKGETNYCFYRREASGLAGYTERKIDNLADFLYPVPTKLGIDEIHVSAKNDDITIPIEDSYAVTVNYRIEAPLAFGEQMSVGFAYDLGNMSVNLGDNVSFREATLTFDVINTLPISFGLDVDILDANGKPIPGVTAKMEGAAADGKAPIQAGSLAAPVTAPVKVEISVAEGQTLNFNGIRLNLKAGDPKVGAVLNKNQGIKVDKASLKLNSGVTVNVGGLTGNN